MIVNLGLLKGCVGRDRCGLMPIRGHSGVQGGAEMGAYATALPGGVPITAETRARAVARSTASRCPTRPGSPRPRWSRPRRAASSTCSTASAATSCARCPIPTTSPRRWRACRCASTRTSSSPTRCCSSPATRCSCCRRRRATSRTAAAPRRAPSGASMFSPEMPRQVGEARAEWRILRELAAAVDPPRADAARLRRAAPAIRDEIARVVPFYDGIQHLRAAGDSFQYGGPHLCAGGRFPTADGKAHFCRRAAARRRAPARHLPRQHPPRQAVQHAHLRRDRSAHRRGARRGAS